MEYLIVFFVGFLVSLLFTPLVRKIAVSRGFFDKPEDILKIHKKPIPHLGGVAIFVSFMVGLIVASLGMRLFEFTRVWGVIVAGSIVFFVGLWDDFKGIKPYVRLLAQISGGIILILSGHRIGFISQTTISVFLTIFYVLGAINSMNLLDGIDGLASGVTTIIGLGFLGSFIMQANTFGIAVSLVFLGSVWGFFPYNFPQAFIFLGDNGSTFLGFILAFLAINLSHSTNIIWFIVSILIMGVPISDTAIAIGRRLVKKRPIFKGDRGHIYDLLMNKGLNQRETVFVFCIVGFVFLIIGLVMGMVS